MVDPPRPARWRCPACGTGLNPVDSDLNGSGSGVVRLECPACGGRFRVKRREGAPGEPSASVFSGEVPAVRASPIKTIGGFGLAWRGVALRVVTPVFSIGNATGAAAMLALGGFVPVGRGWLRDEVSGWPGVVSALGGVTPERSASARDEDLGVDVIRSDAPDLFAELGEVARAVKARPPETVRLVYPPCCGVRAWKKSRCLLIGLPLLQALNRGEFRAVLAHEMAHLARGDEAAEDRAERFVQGLSRAIDSAPIPSRSPLRAWALICRALASRLHAPITWGREARADRAAASVAGGAVAASALVKVAAVQPLFRMAADAFDPDSDPRTLYGFFREFLARLPESILTDIRHERLANGETSADPSHPPLLDRLAAVQEYPSRSAFDNDREPASSLLGDPERFEAMLHDRLFAVGRVEPSVFHRPSGRK